MADEWARVLPGTLPEAIMLGIMLPIMLLGATPVSTASITAWPCCTQKHPYYTDVSP